MHSKKYHTIKEVSEMLGVSQSTLRYAEKHLPKLKIHTINGRRYYTNHNIGVLRSAIGTPMDYSAMLLKIDFLEKQSMKIMDIIAPVLW